MKSKTNVYKKTIDSLIADNQPFVANDLFEKTSQQTMKKCIEEFDMIYIDMNNYSNDKSKNIKRLSINQSPIIKLTLRKHSKQKHED